MYILAGKLKGRKIAVDKSLRAVEARIKQVLFNLFKEEIGGALILDLFAGSGSLGIEALSWGASRAVFTDINRTSFNTIRENLSSLGLIDQAEVYLKDGLEAVKDFSRKKRRFGFIFLDPPYRTGLLTKSLKILEAYDILEHSGFVVCLGWQKEAVESGDFLCLFSRQYGDRLVKVFTSSSAQEI